MKTLRLLWKCCYVKDETQKVGIQLQDCAGLSPQDKDIMALNCSKKKKI